MVFIMFWRVLFFAVLFSFVQELKLLSFFLAIAVGFLILILPNWLQVLIFGVLWLIKINLSLCKLFLRRFLDMEGIKYYERIFPNSPRLAAYWFMYHFLRSRSVQDFLVCGQEIH